MQQPYLCHEECTDLAISCDARDSHEGTHPIVSTLHLLVQLDDRRQLTDIAIHNALRKPVATRSGLRRH